MALTSEHEALHRIFQRDLELFARAMNRILGADLPVPDQVSVMTVDLTETLPMERRVDSVLLAEFIGESSCGRYILVIESQTQPDEERRSRWPYAIAYLHDKYGCDVVLLVVCSKRATARWAREPIKIGVGGLVSMIVNPAVLGPDNVPAVTDPAEAAQDVCFTMLSALTHSRSREVGAILEVLADALTTVDAQTGASLAEFTEAGLGKTAGRIIWRQLMATKAGYPYVSQMRREGQREGRREGRIEGRIEGRREDILRIFDKRGIEVPDEVRDAVNGCDDTRTLDRWFDLALVVTDSKELLLSA